MSKLKSALLISVALSPIFVSATRGIEVVHAEVVQKAVAQQVKKAAETKPAQKTDEKKSADKKTNTVTATKQDDSGTTDSNKADSDVKKSDIIAFDDKNFQQKFKATNYYQQQKAMYGENKPASDAKLAADSVGYLATIIGEKFIESVNKPTIMRALGFAGPIGSLLSCLIDWFTPAARDKTDDKLNEIGKKLDDLGIHLDNVGSALSDKINQASIENRIESFKDKLKDTRTPFGTVAGKISQYQSGHHINLASKDKDDVQKYVNEYAKLYHTSKWGFDDKQQDAVEVPDSENLQVFNDFCKFGAAIVSSDFKENNIFRVMSNYESLREFFNTQTFATREAFAEYVMSHYTVWASDMMTAIFFDYFRVKGQLDQITASDDYKASVTAAKTNGTTIDSEFKARCPISYTLFNGLRSNARDDLMRLGYDVQSDNGHNDSYDLDEYDKNQWVYKYNNSSVFINSSEDNILGANVNAVDYAYALEVENKPVKKDIRFDSHYDQILSDARNKTYVASQAYDKYMQDHASDPFRNDDPECIKLKAKYDEAMKIQNEIDYDKIGEAPVYDVNGSPLPGKLKAEEKTSNDGKMLYSYRNNKWVYSKLVSGPAAYAAKHMVEKNDLPAVKKMSGGENNIFFGACWVWNHDIPNNNPDWDKAYENVMSNDDIGVVNTSASSRNKGGINSILANTVTREVNGIQVLGFSGLGQKNRIIGGDRDYSFTGEDAGFVRSPTYNIGLGFYQNNQHTSPTTEQKTMYQNFSYTGTGFDKSQNAWVQDYHDKHYDQEDVSFIKLVKDGDNELGALNNGKKTPVAADHFVE